MERSFHSLSRAVCFMIRAQAHRSFFRRDSHWEAEAPVDVVAKAGWYLRCHFPGVKMIDFRFMFSG
jgi:hypothetical protein